MPRNVTAEPHDPRSRFALYRLCDCPTCGGSGKESIAGDWTYENPLRVVKCPDCRGEGRIRQELATAETPEAVGVAIVALAREGEWEECPFGLLDTMPPCQTCEGRGFGGSLGAVTCPKCNGSGVKPTGTWLVSPWLPSARNVSDAGRVLARSKKTSRTQ